MNDGPLIRFACRVYGAFLVLYPRAYREDYGAQMEQLFRDQCREAARSHGPAGVLQLCARTLLDFLFSTVREHASEQYQQMKQITPSKASLILIVLTLLLQQAAASLAFGGQPLAVWCLWLATLLFVARGVTECVRPASEWKRGLLWALGIAVAYGFICPVWGHIADRAGLNVATSAAFKAHLAAFVINLLVPLVKAVIALAFRPRA